MPFPFHHDGPIHFLDFECSREPLLDVAFHPTCALLKQPWDTQTPSRRQKPKNLSWTFCLGWRHGFRFSYTGIRSTGGTALAPYTPTDSTGPLDGQSGPQSSGKIPMTLSVSCVKSRLHYLHLWLSSFSCSLLQHTAPLAARFLSCLC